jgi:hypothetical protein
LRSCNWDVCGDKIKKSVHGMDNRIVGLWCHAPSKTMRGRMV